jgi:hypothetical protein
MTHRLIFVPPSNSLRRVLRHQQDKQTHDTAVNGGEPWISGRFGSSGRRISGRDDRIVTRLAAAAV